MVPPPGKEESAVAQENDMQRLQQEAVRRVREAVEAGDKALAAEAASKACRLFDKAVSKGIIHKNQAANRKSGVMALANSLDK